MTSLLIIRGLPGAGKSTLARKLLLPTGSHFEADMYFYDESGKYVYDGMKIGQAHEWCQEEVDKHLHYGMDVIVSNTFTTQRELRPYFYMAKKHGIVPNVISCQSNFGSIHGVPPEVMAKMKARFDNNIDALFEILTSKDEDGKDFEF